MYMTPELLKQQLVSLNAAIFLFGFEQSKLWDS